VKRFADHDTTPAEDPHARLRDTWLVGWSEGRMLLTCYAVMVGMWTAVGFAVVHWTDDTFVGRADVDLDQGFADRRTPTWNDLSLAGSLLSETAVKIAVTAIVGAVLLFVFRRWFETLVIAASLVLEAMVFITVTMIVGRPRPDVPHLDGSPVGSSFPSGHVAAAACYGAMAIVLFWHTRRTWLRGIAVVLTIVVPIIVALARMYRGMHYLTDVVAGALLGVASVVLVTHILCRAEERRRSHSASVTGSSGVTGSASVTGDAQDLSASAVSSPMGLVR
jgi:membrane-associated phospholipid phosphatase